MIPNQESYASIEQVIAEQGVSISTVKGISMYPLLRQRRDMIVVEKLNRPLKKHDVPLYRHSSGKLILHRILKITPDCYIIRGDNTYVLEYVPKENVIGVLKEFYRNGKRYDCEKSKIYKVYIFFMRLFYPVRYFWKKLLKPFLVKIKIMLLNKKPL